MKTGFLILAATLMTVIASPQVAAQSATELGKSLGSAAVHGARQAGTPNAADFGASAQTRGGPAQSSTRANYGWKASVDVTCLSPDDHPVYTSAVGTTLSCVAASPAISISICEPKLDSDVADNACTTGIRRSATLSPGQSRQFGEKLAVRVTSCGGQKCVVEVSRSGKFEGGTDEVDAQGQAAMAEQYNTEGSVASATQGVGVVTTDGVVISGGKNTNANNYSGTMLSQASYLSTCAQSTQASLNDGTPVFTCDGAQSVDVDGSKCETVESCVKWVSDTQKWTESCDISLNTSATSCVTTTPIKTCNQSSGQANSDCSVSTSVGIRSSISFDVGCGEDYFFSEAKPLTDAPPVSNKAYCGVIGWSSRDANGYPLPPHWTQRTATHRDGKRLQTYCPPDAAYVFLEKFQIPNYPYGVVTFYIPTCYKFPSCPAGYLPSEGNRCMQPIDTNGFTYFGEQPISISGQTNAKATAYRRESENGNCGIYEASQ